MSNWYSTLSSNFSLANSHYGKIWKITFEPYIIENQGSQTERRKYKSQHAIEAMKWMTVQLTWQREDGKLSEIAVQLFKFDNTVELISSHYLLEKKFSIKKWGNETWVCIHSSMCMPVCVSPSVEADATGRSSARLLDHADNEKVSAETVRSNNCRNTVMVTLDWLLAVGKLFLMSL